VTDNAILPATTSGGRPLRVLHLTAASDAGGLSRYVVDLTAAMHAAGHALAVMGDVGAWQHVFDAAPVPYVRVPLQRGAVGFARSVTAARAFVREFRPDVVHTHYRRATALARAAIATARGRDRRPPVLYTVHGSHIAMGWPRNWLTDFGDHTHAPSADVVDWLVRDAGLSLERITVIPHGVDVARFTPADAAGKAAARAALDLPADATVAAFVGRLDHPKNADWMLDVAAAARDRVAGLRVVLAGDGPDEPALRRRIAAEGLGDRVTLLGHRDPLVVYHAADAVLSPSLREGFSLAAAEAMAAGVPVLRTRTSGTTELIVQGVTGRWTPIDRRAFAAAAVEFLSDRAKLAAMGAAAASHVHSQFTHAGQVERTLDLYRRLTTAAAASTRGGT